jgi:hypothetical protein
MTTACRSSWHIDTRTQPEPGDRVVCCGLPTGHDGDHDEMVDGEAGVNTWPQRQRFNPRIVEYVNVPRDQYEALRRVAEAARPSFADVSTINRQRCERWHPNFPNDGWTGSDWSNAMAGEAGEACNKVKKLRRLDFDITQAAGDTRQQLLADLATEIGDTFLYLDLLAQFYGLDLLTCVVDTFNRVSVREGFPERLVTAVDALDARDTP